MELKRFCR